MFKFNLKMSTIYKIVSIVFLLLSLKVYAQENESSSSIVTDRPNATEASSTVGSGILQFETGALYTSFEETELKNDRFIYNTTVVRYGIFENLELRLGWNFEENKQTLGAQDSLFTNVLSGFSPLLAGVKIAIAEEKGWRPKLALIGHVYLPFTAGTDYRPETTGTEFRFLCSNTLSEKSSIGYNIGAQWRGDNPEASYIYSLAYNYTITSKFGFFIEVYGDLPENNKANHLWDAGLTYLINSNLQIDGIVGSSITAGQDILLGAGISYRLPKKSKK